MDPEDPVSWRLARNRLGRKAQVGGGLAAFIGLALLVLTPPAPPGAAMDLHQMATIFIVIGICLLASGSFARWYYLE